MDIKNCYTGTAIEQIEEGCKGNYISTDCIQTPNAISYLDLPAGSSQTEVNAAITSSLLFKDQQISEISATKIEAGENVEITGVGTEEQPYVISSLGGSGELQDLQSVLSEGSEGLIMSALKITSPSITLTSVGVDSPNTIVVNDNSTGGGGRIWINSQYSAGVTIDAGGDGLTVNSPITRLNSESVMLKTYTVSTLPIVLAGSYATVSDALTPTYLAPVVGGGTVVTPVFYNGTNWVCH